MPASTIGYNGLGQNIENNKNKFLLSRISALILWGKKNNG